MSYSASIDYLLSLQKQGVKLGIGKMQTLLDLLGNPQKSFRSLHVAGTNGKGSVSAICASLLSAHGYRVALYTSPHLVSFTERMRVNGKEIAESEVVSLADEIRDLLGRNPDVPTPTFFEFVTAMAFLHFARMNVKWAVVETGMGGRLDATNVIEPTVSVITSVGMDHGEYLGSSVAEIATEKAGIIKAGVPVVSSFQQPVVQTVIARTARDLGCETAFYGKDFVAYVRNSSFDGTEFDYISGDEMIAECRVPLAGVYQAENAAVALRAVSRALDPVSDGAPLFIAAGKAHAGLRDVYWPGRLEIIDREPLTIVDGAHNPAAAEALAEFIGTVRANYSVVLVAGMLADKDMAGVLKPLCSVAHSILVTAPDSSRAASPEVLAAIVREIGRDCEIFPSVPAALEHARLLCRNSSAISGRDPLILVAGSLYMAGEASREAGRASHLGEVREWR